MDILDESGVGMKRFSPDKPTGIGNYKVLKFEVAATGEYFELVDFMDRLERGSRYVRIDEFEIQAEQSVLSLRCRILCLAGVTYEQQKLLQMDEGEGELPMTGMDPDDMPAPDRAIHMEAMPEAMAAAGRLLKTGEPPTLPYRCIYKYYVGPGAWENLLLEFKRGGSSRKYLVEVTRASGPDAKRYPDTPMNF